MTHAELEMQRSRCKQLLAKIYWQRYLGIVNDEPEVRRLDSGALRALAHPLRVDIYDIINQFGPQTASTLAERLDESTGATSYHLRALAKHDLIREAPGLGHGRERWWERVPGPVEMGVPDARRTPAGRAATQVVLSEFYRRRNEQLQEFLKSGMRSDSDVMTALLTTATVRMTDEQFEALASEVQEVIDAAAFRYRDQQGPGVRPFTVRADIYPLEGEQQ